MAPAAGTEAGRAEHAIGAGGDRTVEVDRLAEEAALAVFERLQGQGARFSLLSEELGRRDFGAPYPLVLMDPVDGSVNAKQGIPVYAAMLSLLGGPTVGDVIAGHVLNLVGGDCWQAVRGGGAWRDGKPLRVLPPARSDRFEVLGIESSARSVFNARPLLERSAKIRILGSMALSIAYTAAGGLDLFCSPVRARVFDMSASLLVLSEAGGVASDFEGQSLDPLPATLQSRSTLLCAADRQGHQLALSLLRAQ